MFFPIVLKSGFFVDIHPKRSYNAAMQLSPKELAKAIGMSESTLKRWIDQGRLVAVRTAGGHRRISREEAIRFVRAEGLVVLQPEKLGVPEVGGEPLNDPLGCGDLLLSLFETGRTEEAGQLLVRAFLDGAPLAALFDGPLGGAMQKLGALWGCGQDVPSWNGVAVEHCATTTALEVVGQLRALLPPLAPNAPKMLVGSLAGDPYLLPSAMVAAVMHEAGYSVIHAGANTPVYAFEALVMRHRPVALAISICGEPEPAWPQDLQWLGALCQQRDIGLWLGGRSYATLAPALAEVPHRYEASLQGLAAQLKRH